MAMQIFTVVILAMTTFIILDVNKNDSFDRTTTAKYLNQIGAKVYVQKLIDTINHSSVYKQYILPSYNSLIQASQPYVTSIRKETLKYSNQVSIWFKNNFTSLLHWIEQQAIPIISENWSRFVSYTQNYLHIVYAKTHELSLNTGDWISKNIFMKFPREEMMKAFTEFVSSTQKVAYNSYEYIAGQLQKLLA